MSKFKKMSKFSLDEKIESSKFNFCKNLKWFLIAPIAICLIGLVLLCSVGFNLGIDFTGGTYMTIFADKENAFTIEGFEESFDISKDMGKIEAKINSVLGEYGLTISTIQKTTISDTDLGLKNGDAVVIKFQNDNSKESSDIEKTNEQIRLNLLKAFGFVESDVLIGDLGSLENASLVADGGITTASASAELLMKSFIALLVAVVLILIYIAVRFELTSGLAAILALFHDLLITASVMLICRIEINVAFIAALITILGYSINNTIIIFDRMRDRLKSAKQTNEKVNNIEVANASVRSTMMRSVLTTLTTFVMIFMVTVIGVPDIREFAFPIMVGILAGFYSSVFITPGLWAIAYKPKKKSKNQKPPQNKDDVVEIVAEN